MLDARSWVFWVLCWRCALCAAHSICECTDGEGSVRSPQLVSVLTNVSTVLGGFLAASCSKARNGVEWLEGVNKVDGSSVLNCNWTWRTF